MSADLSATMPDEESREGIVMAVESAADFAVVAYQEDGRWQAAPLPPRVADDLHGLVAALRQQPAEGGTIGLVSVDEDFFVAVRLVGHDVRLLLSDITAAVDSPLAREILEELDVPVPDEDDLDQVEPAGDLDLFTDLGMDAMELGALCDDLELYPDEMLGSVASRLGFGDPFQRAVETALN
jgi:putative tRNA adenosine deaminase-associated protein